MKRGALKPISDIRAVWEEKNEAEAKRMGVDVDDAKLSSLSKQAGWKILKDHIEGLKDGLDKRLSESVLNSLSDKQIQNDALFAILGKELLSSIINKVEDSAEEVNDITTGQ